MPDQALPVNGTAVEHGSEISFKQHLSYAAIGCVLLVIAVASLYVSSKLLTEINKSKESAAVLAENLSDQKKEVKKLRAEMSALQAKVKSSENKWESAVRDLKGNLKAKEKEIADATINYSIMRVLVNDLTATNQKLMDQFISLNEEVEKITQVQPAQ